MPPDATQNLNSQLSAKRASERRQGKGINWQKPPIQGSAPPVRIVGAAATYRGGYHLSF
jgi:hypothetical protein